MVKQMKVLQSSYYNLIIIIDRQEFQDGKADEGAAEARLEKAKISLDLIKRQVLFYFLTDKKL